MIAYPERDDVAGRAEISQVLVNSLRERQIAFQRRAEQRLVAGVAGIAVDRVWIIQPQMLNRRPQLGARQLIFEATTLDSLTFRQIPAFVLELCELTELPLG